LARLRFSVLKLYGPNLFDACCHIYCLKNILTCPSNDENLFCLWPLPWLGCAANGCLSAGAFRISVKLLLKETLSFFEGKSHLKLCLLALLTLSVTKITSNQASKEYNSIASTKIASNNLQE